VAFPPRAVRLALQAGDVREQLTQGDPAHRGAGQVLFERVIEGEQTLVP
jgi:hypothetical protein